MKQNPDYRKLIDDWLDDFALDDFGLDRASFTQLDHGFKHDEKTLALIRALANPDLIVTTVPLLAAAFHDEYNLQDWGCRHQNQHRSTWDCQQRADEIAAALKDDHARD